MKTEEKTLIYSMINNLVIAILKIIGGIIFHLSSLFADGMHTFSDFVTDIVCLAGAKLSRKKPTKTHPYGFGKIEYLTNIFVGIVLFLLAIYIIVSSFSKEVIIPPLTVLILLVLVFVLKLIAIFIMNKVGEDINSQLLITSVDESKADLYSTIGVVIITILLQFSPKLPILEYADVIGTILIGLIVFKTSISIIVGNSLSIIGEIDDNPEVTLKLEDILEKYSDINNYEIALIMYGSYYKLQLTLELNPKLKLSETTKISNDIKRTIIRHRSLKIKYVALNIVNKIQ